jgi:NAD(P)-dependent dehydrogenase (short-subunit alcohol dehydrogenase family)
MENTRRRARPRYQPAETGGGYEMKRLKGKVALITGAGMGQGRAAAQIFAREGAKIIVGDVDEKAGKETVSLIKKNGGDAIFKRCDVGKEADCAALVKAGVKAFGKLNVIYNNAGVLWKDKDVSLVNIDMENWKRITDICLMGAVYICRHGIPEMKKAGGGSIINVGSISALTGSSIPQDAYNASKGALIILTKSIAIQFAKDKIRCNIIHPGMINTPMQHKYMKSDAWLKAVLDCIPLGIFGEPEDIANAALFLASDESKFMTGAEMVVDGGFMAT